ncbi:hypothetical protein ATG98_2175 [Marinobacter sp. LV10R520-4]|nr:hypothetical protein ATG98_2175 [Marinobacter sp. LV10R520-4]
MLLYTALFLHHREAVNRLQSRIDQADEERRQRNQRDNRKVGGPEGIGMTGLGEQPTMINAGSVPCCSVAGLT